MPEVYKRLYQGQPGIAAATAYTAAAAPSPGAVMKHLRAVNVGTTAASVGLFHGGTGVANRILPDVPLQPGEWLEGDMTLMLAPGDTLAVIASVAATITLTLYGVELA